MVYSLFIMVGLSGCQGCNCEDDRARFIGNWDLDTIVSSQSSQGELAEDYSISISWDDEDDCIIYIIGTKTTNFIIALFLHHQLLLTFNNAIEHGASYRTTEGSLSIDVAFADGRLSVEFVDPEMPEPIVRELAEALQAAANGMPSLENERGRGLFLISIYMEELRVDVAPGGGMRLLGSLNPA